MGLEPIYFSFENDFNVAIIPFSHLQKVKTNTIILEHWEIILQLPTLCFSTPSSWLHVD